MPGARAGGAFEADEVNDIPCLTLTGLSALPAAPAVVPLNQAAGGLLGPGEGLWLWCLVFAASCCYQMNDLGERELPGRTVAGEPCFAVMRIAP